MKGLRDDYQRVRVCRLFADWLKRSGCGFEVWNGSMPTEDSFGVMRAHGNAAVVEMESNIQQRRWAMCLSPGQTTVFRFLFDLWDGSGEARIVDVAKLQPALALTISQLMVALQSSPNDVDEWLDETRRHLALGPGDLT